MLQGSWNSRNDVLGGWIHPQFFFIMNGFFKQNFLLYGNTEVF